MLPARGGILREKLENHGTAIGEFPLVPWSAKAVGFSSIAPIPTTTGLPIMLELTELFLMVLAALSALPAAILAGECLLALWPSDQQLGRGTAPKRPRTVVLVPAHDELGVVGNTVRGLIPQLGYGDRVLVVADNCSDATADEARAAGAVVIERIDATRRGKGYAISFGIEHLRSVGEDHPDVVIVVDADCQVSSNGIEVLSREAIAANRPIQADYVLNVPEIQTAFSYVSALAFLIRNRVRAHGLHRLGLPVHLSGTGMAFPWAVIRAALPTSDHLIEDRIMGIDLALKGYPPRFCPAVRVTGVLPNRDDAAIGQRRRWEHGHLASMLRWGFKLTFAGFIRMCLGLIALGGDLLVPPLALFAAWLAGLAVVSVPFGILTGRWQPLVLTGVDIGLLVVAVLFGWLRYGRQQIPFRYAAAIPLYIIRKVPMYIAFAIGRRQQTWERTERTREANTSEDDQP